MADPLNKQPRRCIEMIAKISADSWEDLRRHLGELAYEIARDGCLSKASVSGGYSSGHIVVTSEDGTITHDSWAATLDEYLRDLAEREGRANG